MNRKVKILSRVIGIAIFLFVLTTNINISISEQGSGGSDFSLLGLEVQMFNNTYGETNNGKKGLIWCLTSNNNYVWACMSGASNYDCGVGAMVCQ